jgi:GTP-binding protein
MSALPVAFVKGVVSLDGLPKAPIPEIAASGRSNVGKSSMLNVVFGRKGMAKVSQTPGKTREINFFTIGDRYHLVDVPGYGYARVPTKVREKWAVLVESYLETRPQLGGLVQLVDVRHGPSAQDREMIEWLAGARFPSLIVATKTDKLKKAACAAALKKLAAELEPFGLPCVGFSAVDRTGRREILRWIDEAVSAWTDAGPEEKVRR